MKQSELESIVKGTPHIFPLFKVIKVSPPKQKLDVKLGDTFVRSESGTFHPFQSASQYNPDFTPSQIEFIGYVNLNTYPSTCLRPPLGSFTSELKIILDTR